MKPLAKDIGWPLGGRTHKKKKKFTEEDHKQVIEKFSNPIGDEEVRVAKLSAAPMIFWLVSTVLTAHPSLPIT